MGLHEEETKSRRVKQPPKVTHGCEEEAGQKPHLPTPVHCSGHCLSSCVQVALHLESVLFSLPIMISDVQECQCTHMCECMSASVQLW